MKTRRIALTLLAVGLISSVCWVSIWAWGSAWRDVGGIRYTIAASYALQGANVFTIRATGPKLLCVDIDSNIYHACDPGPGNPQCPQWSAWDDAVAPGCDPMVTITNAFGQVVAMGDDVWYVPPAPLGYSNKPGAPLGMNYPPIYPQWPWHQDYDPFVCWYTSAATAATFSIRVEGSTYYGVPTACDYYMMTVSSTPWKTGGTLTPAPASSF